MNDLLAVTLKKALQNPDLSGNNTLKAINLFYDSQKRIPEKDEILSFHKAKLGANNEQSESGNIDTATPYTDKRLKSLLLKGFRKFSTTDNATYYQLSFCNESGTPLSSIYLGRNGIGKSTLYGALEFVCLNDSYSAEARGFVTDKEKKVYIGDIAYGSTTPDVQVQTMNEWIKNHSSASPCTLPAFFCSEYDIDQLSKANKNSQGKNSDATEYIITQLGFRDLLQLKTTLEDLLREQEELYEELPMYKKHIEERSKELSETIALYSLAVAHDTKAIKNDSTLKECLQEMIACTTNAQISDLEWQNTLLTRSKKLEKELIKVHSGFSYLTERIKNFKRLSNDYLHNKNALIDEVKALNRIYNDIDAILFKNKNTETFNENIQMLCKDIDITRKNLIQGELVDFPSWEQEIRPIYKYIREVFQEQFTKAAKIIEEVVPRILNNWLNDQRDEIPTEIKVNITNTKATEGLSDNNPKIDFLLRPISPAGTDFETEPRQFLNTFRFKLYCVALKVSLVCCAKKIQNTNFPVIIDDVFNSSDFDNRVEIATFIDSILTAHDNIITEKDKKLQLIFFTQDELIAESVCKGFSQNNAYSKDFKLSTLFTPKEGVKEDKHKITISKNETINCLLIEDRIK